MEPASIHLVLGIPLIGAAVLGLVGQRTWAAEANAAMSLGTFAASAFLVARVIEGGPFTAAMLPQTLLDAFGLTDSSFKEQLFVDSFNVFLVALTAFVGFTTAL